MQNVPRLLLFAGLGVLLVSVLFVRAADLLPRAPGKASVVLTNKNACANYVKVVDRNAGDAVRFDGWLAPGALQVVPCAQNESGYCHLATSTDGRPLVNRPFLRPGDRVGF